MRAKSICTLSLIGLFTGCMAPDDEVDTSETFAKVGDLDTTSDSIGTSTTAAPMQIDLSTNNPFFHDFGSNARTCGTCHVEKLGWTITPSFVRSRPANDPIFVFDGSDCLPGGVPNPDPVRNSTQLRQYGNVRIDIPIPPGADFHLGGLLEGAITCPTPPSAANLRMYRRPLPSSNTAFLATVMWDGRENVNAPNDTPALMRANLLQQSNDATRGHAQSDGDLGDADQSAIVNFETKTFNAQQTIGSLNLSANGGYGGAAYLLTNVLSTFFIGVNDVFSPTFNKEAFTIYRNWEPGKSPPNAQAAAIGRGERLFNTHPILIRDVPGLNGPKDSIKGAIPGFCTSCHDTPNVGNHSVSLQIDIGITSVNPVGGLDISRLPRYLFVHNTTGEVAWFTDGGRGLITGKFADLGKTKGPVLRGLATRAPYFHNGSAPDLLTVVNFYDARFGMLLTPQEKSDLVAFLQAL
jgi:cytochrome c peroxidase